MGQDQNDKKIDVGLIEFRLSKLEEAIQSISEIKACIIKWESRFSQNQGFLNCQVHSERLQNFESRLSKVEQLIESLDRFKWKAVGVLSVIILMIQLFGTAVFDKMISKPESQPVKIQLLSGTNSHIIK